MEVSAMMGIEWVIVAILGLTLISLVLLFVLFMRTAWHAEMDACGHCGRNEWVKVEGCPHIVECTKCHHRENIGLDEEEGDNDKTE